MKAWICQNDIHSLLKNGCKEKNNMVTLFQKADCIYEKMRLYPILIDNKKAKKYIKSIEWDFVESKNKIFIPDRKRYLGIIIQKYYPNLLYNGGNYNDINGQIVSSIVKNKAFEEEHSSISICLSGLLNMLQNEKKELFVVVECFRFSERTLDEFSLEDDRTESYFPDYCFSFSSRPINGGFVSTRDMFSTITTFRGKAKFKIAH